MTRLRRGSSWTAIAALTLTLVVGCGNHGQGSRLWNAPAPQLTQQAVTR